MLRQLNNTKVSRLCRRLTELEKDMTTRHIFVAAIMMFVVFAYSGASRAAGGFSVKSLKGVYGFSGSGTLATMPAAVAGLNSFDRAGGCDITAKINIGGAVAAVTTNTCTYVVNPDGTGFLDVTFNEPFPGLPGIKFHSDFVIVDGAREVHAVLSDNLGMTVATSISKRQSAGASD
jgi:hypothetical protein